MLGGLLGAYGSEEEEEEVVEEQPAEGTQLTGQVTLLRDEEAGDLDHLTSGAAVRPAQADPPAAAAAPAGGGGDQQGPRPQSAASQQAADGAAAEPMAADEQPQAVGGGAAQPPADPLSLLPPELCEPPEGECDPEVQAKVANWLVMQRTRGKYINQELRKSRGYRNPEFFAKMVEHLRIQQYGTAFAPEVFDPSALPAEDFLDALQREWAAEEERRKAARAAGQGRVDFQKSASQPSLMPSALKPGLNQALHGATLQPQSSAHPPATMSAATAAAMAKAAAVAAAVQQHHAQTNSNAAAALAAAQAKAAQLAAQLQRR